MGWIVFIIFGGIAGWIASMLAKRNGSMGVLANILVGIVGSWIGSFIMNQFGYIGVTGFNLRSFIIAVAGAALLLALFNLIRKKK